MAMMPRKYRSAARATSAARTRQRILRTARRLLSDATDVPVDTIADEAGVSVQTLYSHFGSKSRLLVEVIDAAQREAGTYVDFERVWQSPDGETALRRMTEATLRIWHDLWDIVEFTERARRADPEIGRHMREVDGYRRSNLRSITDRLAVEGRLRAGVDAGRSADVAFALTLPSVYEELVLVRAWPSASASGVVVASVMSAIVDETTTPVMDPPADWSMVLQPPEAIGTMPR